MRVLLTSAFAAALSAACSKDASAPGVSSPPAVALSASSAPARPPGPPENGNVILLSVDSLRADMPWAGYPRPIAPNLTALEHRAVFFPNAYSISSYTSMSLGGLLGGRVPSELVRDGYFFGIYRKNVFFPKLLQKAGVHTMGVMAHMYFKSAGFDLGFDDWRIVPGITFDANTDKDITSPQHEKIAEEMLGDPANDNRRFFFWAHFLDPHDLYQQHDGIDWGKSPRDRYDGEVQFTDQYLGKLLDFIETKSWAKRTTIIVTADHGEEFGEHGMTRHGFEVWNTLVHVPLMVIAPGATPHHIDLLRSGIDLAPTIMELLGVPGDPGFEGTSLVGEVYGGWSAIRDVLVDLPMTSNSGRRRALLHATQNGTQKLICFDTDGDCRLYDLAHDPMEKSPIVRGEAFADMKARYDAATRNVKEVAPYACGADCLNGAYMKKQQRQQDGAQ